MFLPGLGYPMRSPEMTDEEWTEIVRAHERSEKIGGWVAGILLALCVTAFFAFWILYAVRFL